MRSIDKFFVQKTGSVAIFSGQRGRIFKTAPLTHVLLFFFCCCFRSARNEFRVEIIVYSINIENAAVKIAITRSSELGLPLKERWRHTKGEHARHDSLQR